ncbi:glycosyltransferase family 2 protein [Amycolatopsis sp. FDAARGOS 1241]|uniref:glycosyltransferase family 2 protein n=1 Tax=Amycolatopsis sp. FDAARGOS 1241 TaxID=2778070 RepID=UPI001952167C|nr:glycosyltransferase family 2 protein [Amycolatopsis sp. FDAARGOS 1241]QRP45115.1 glycosyltransferase family 2 protein [Amycolatopsis sp. FDAARGOS 1241]
MTSAEPGTTVVVVTWRGAAHVTACLDALAAQTRPHRTLVVDNASDDGTAALLAAHPSRPEVVRLRRNTGYAGAMAEALRRVETPQMAWLNDDAAPEPTWLAELEDTFAEQPLAAAVTSHLELADGTTQSTGVRLTADGHGADLTEPAVEVFGFCGGAALLRTEAVRAVGGVPASFFCYYEDTDTAWRLRLAGWHVVAAPKARVRHLHGASTKPGSPLFHRWNERNRLLMLLRCAPAAVAAREVLRFAVITALLPLRRRKPGAANFQVGLRVRVLAEVLTRLPSALRERKRIDEVTALGRGAIWDAWAGL